MTRSVFVIAACVLCMSVMVAPGFAGQTCKPVMGHFEASIVLPGEAHCPNIPGAFCTAGRVWGGLQGTYQFVMTGAVPSSSIGGPATVLFFVGNSSVNLKSGDTLQGTDTGSIDLPPGQGGFASLITFTGGTGKMVTATGQIRLRGEFDAAAGSTTGDYVGQVCAP